MIKDEYLRKWKNCTSCELHRNANHHVVTRGTIPASVVIIGEAPGKTEDKLGKPFIGRSGQLLTTALQRLSVASYCITNVVCCIPLQQNYSLEEDFSEPKSDLSIRPPSADEADECAPHLLELIELCQPKLICLLGKEAEKYTKGLAPNIKKAILRHPAYVLRRGGINSVEFKRFLTDFETALTEADVTHLNIFNSVPTGV